jgi:hypothetical protein
VNAVQKTCPVCGVVFCLPECFDEERREDHATWYCPNGHPLHYPAESPKEREIRLLKESVGRRDRQLAGRADEIAALRTEVRSLRSRLAWARRRAASGSPLTSSQMRS